MAASSATPGRSLDTALYDVICDAGPAGISASRLGQRTHALAPRVDRNAALRRLREQGRVECFKRPSRTKPTTVYCVAGEQSCGTCRFWIGGKCRRYPPVPYWPKMGADEWCGEYQSVGLGRDGK
jgi:hypothetical protein